MKNFHIHLLSLLVLLGCSKSKQDNTKQEISARGKTTLELFREGNLAGYRDLSGRVVITPQFVEAGDFSWSLARVKPNAKGGWGYIDESGTEIIHPQYEAAGDFVDGMTVVLSKGQFIYIAPDGSSLGLFEEDHPQKALSGGDTLYVIHPNGLIARASGDVHAAPVCHVPLDGAVELASNFHGNRSKSNDGLLGNWLLVRYQQKSGYLFDLYLSRHPRMQEHQPAERYRLISSSLNNDEYSAYTLTKFATGGHSIEHDGPNWVETREIVPNASVDQVVARLKLSPAGTIGLLLTAFHGTPGFCVTEKGDSVTVNVQRTSEGFLENLTISRKNEESTFDISISKHAIDAAEIVTTSSTRPADSNLQTANPF